MDLTLTRTDFTEKSTIGKLAVNGLAECYTLEDRDRWLENGGIKIPGKTAIPRGKYSIIIDWSNRFKRTMPRLLTVAGFEGIRIHAGNTAENTEGCILVGRTREIDFIGESKVAFEQLFGKLEQAFNKREYIWIEIL